MKQHTKPCKECPFRRESLPEYLGGNDPKSFAFLSGKDGNFECHLTMSNSQPAQCAGRAIMWANSCKKSRDGSVPELKQDREKVFSHIGEFTKHHKIEISPIELMFGPESEEEEANF